MAGKLYLVPTPIGNLEDITYRAVRTLQEVDIIAAEDTRHTGILLKHLNIQKPMISYHEHNKEDKGQYLIQCLLEEKSIAQVSDAGMPAISDPGADLVKKAIAEHIDIVPLPGPNAGLTALIASGLDTTEFTFVGFLPKRSNHRREELQRLKTYAGTLIFYEAPHRLKEVLPDMLNYLGDRPICIGRELTKKFETFTRLSLQQLLEDLEQITFKGEFVLLVGGATTASETMILSDMLAIQNPIELVNRLQNDGLAKKDAIREVAKQLGMARRDVYNLVEKNNL